MGTPPRPPEEPPPPPPTDGVDGPPLQAGNCPRCGNPYEPLQEYCLECGLRLPLSRGLIGVLATAWQRRIPWYPGDWIWIVLLLLVLAGIGGAVAVLATRDDDKSGVATKVGTTSPPPGTTAGTVGEEPPAGTDTAPVPSIPTETEPIEPEPPPVPQPGTLVGWPAGQSGFTIVLESLPSSSGRGAALARARKASDAGLTDVGVLNSSDFASLQPGYYVVFTGIYTTLEEARSGISAAQGSYPNAYTREIQP